MGRLHLEFMVEPFVEGRPGPHVTAAVDAARVCGLDVDVGPFASTATGPDDAVAAAVAAVLRHGFAAGATRISVQVASEPLRSADAATASGALDAPGAPPLDLNGALARMLTELEIELDVPLDQLDRTAKQAAVRVLDERGAFTLRRAIEDVADALGVSRVTVYNYLDAIRADR